MAGENARFFYRFAKGGYEATARCTAVSHAMQVVATESHARQSRAMYPRQRAMGKFMVKLAFKGYFEHYAFMSFLNGYCRAMMESSDDYHSPGMSVTVLGEDGFNFFRIGIPVQGMSEGDHVGSMVFEPNIVFETIYDPLDTRTINEQTSWEKFASTFEFPEEAENDVNKFFYPMSKGSNNAYVKPDDIYGVGESNAGTSLTPTAPSKQITPGAFGGNPLLMGN